MRVKYIDEFKNLDKKGRNVSQDIAKKRGEEFEKLINDVLEDEELLIQRSYRINTGVREQIDGAIKIESKIFLIEVKWVESGIAASELYSFIGKVDNKLDGTLGIFISRAKLSESVIAALNKGRRQRVLAIHGQDLDELFKDDISFKEYLIEAINELSIRNEPHYSVKQYVIKREAPTKVKKAADRLNQSISDYIEKHLLVSNQADPTFSALAYWSLAKESKKLVFEFIVLNYPSFYQLPTEFQGTSSDHHIIHKINSYIFEFIRETWEDKVSIELVKKYYSTLIYVSPVHYQKTEFTELFAEYYGQLNDSDRASIEKKFASKLKEFYGDYYRENYLTNIIAPIWRYISTEQKVRLVNLYLEFFTSDRVKSFPQMVFAKKLLDEHFISKDKINEWIYEKVEKDYRNYQDLNVPRSYASLSERYIKLAQYLDIHETNWATHVSSLFGKSIDN